MVPLSQAMQKLRVSVVQYLNTAPLVWGFLHGPQQGQAELSFTVPSGCAEALRTGAADVGIIPSIAYQTIPGLKIIPGVALVAHGSVESVLLVSRVPAAEARTVALDQSSQTSAALVRILFARHWKTEPHYVSAVPDLEAMLARADAALLIGDPALQFALNSVAQHAREHLGQLFVYDLAAEWHHLTGLPFVFALWAVRGTKATPEASGELARLFIGSREFGMARLDDIVAAAALQLNLPPAGLARYLSDSVRFSFDDDARAGLDAFYRAAHELGLIPPPRPLEFV